MNFLDESIRKQNKRLDLENRVGTIGERGESFPGGVMLTAGFFYSLIVPGIHGYKLGSGNLSEIDFSKFGIGLILGGGGGGLTGGYKGAIMGAVLLELVEVISFGAGYGIGYLTK